MFVLVRRSEGMKIVESGAELILGLEDLHYKAWRHTLLQGCFYTASVLIYNNAETISFPLMQIWSIRTVPSMQ